MADSKVSKFGGLPGQDFHGWASHIKAVVVLYKDEATSQKMLKGLLLDPTVRLDEKPSAILFSLITLSLEGDAAKVVRTSGRETGEGAWAVLHEKYGKASMSDVSQTFIAGGKMTTSHISRTFFR